MIPARRLQGSLSSFPFVKVGLGILAALYLYIAAATLSTTGLEGAGLVKIIALAVAPICIFCAFRYPVVFPFGVYTACLPFDALLAASSTASILKILAFAASAAFAFRMLRLRTVLAPHTSWYAWLALLLYNALTLFWAVDYSAGLQTVIALSGLFLLMTLLATYPISVRELRIIASTVVVAGAAAGVYCIHQYYSGHFTDEAAPRLALQAGSTTIDPNYLAGAFLLPLALALYGIFYVRNTFVKILCLITLPAFMGSIFVTGSRECLFAAIAIFGYFVLRGSQRLPALALGAACCSAVLLFPSFVTRMFESNAADGSGRTEIWATGLHSFADHWLLGAGVSSYATIYDQNVLQVAVAHFAGWHRPGHSVIVESLTDLGVLGTALTILAWYLSFRQLRVIPRGSELYGLRVACEAIVLGYAFQGFFIDSSYIKYLWFAHSMPLILLNVYDPRMIGFGRRRAPQPAAIRTAHAPTGG